MDIKTKYSLNDKVYIISHTPARAVEAYIRQIILSCGVDGIQYEVGWGGWLKHATEADIYDTLEGAEAALNRRTREQLEEEAKDLRALIDDLNSDITDFKVQVKRATVRLKEVEKKLEVKNE